MLSATAGALLAFSLASTPLMQSQLSAEELEVFSSDDLAKMNMRLPELTRPVNILVLGTKVITSDVDLPATESGYEPLVNSLDGLSDSMLMVRFDPKDSKLSLLSIPRDTYSWVEGLGETKINEANRLGGPALSAKSVNELLGGVGIDRYVRINVQGIEKLVDALGGVTVYIPKDMKYTDNTQHLYIDLKKGEQHLNGEQALQFLRFRYDTWGDIGRIQRQQMLMRATIEQALNPATLVRMPQILSVIQDHIDTNLSIEELVALVGFASNMTRENTQMLMLPGEFNTPASPNHASYWLPNYNAIDEMMAAHFDRGYQSERALAIDPAYVRVAIQDTTEQPMAVDALFDKLGDGGYTNVYEDRPWGESLEVTRILAQSGDLKSAERLQRVLGFGEVTIDSTGAIESDITIQVGRDWLDRQESYLPPDLW
ncbi:MAG: LCP family protein [Cyanobacteriota bacterium]|nr:LCP family protein [Cyanobacteriota bacterium]